MKYKKELEEEVEFWLGYINKWQATNNELIPDRVQLLLNNAVSKLEADDPDNNQALPMQGNKHTIH